MRALATVLLVACSSLPPAKTMGTRADDYAEATQATVDLWMTSNFKPKTLNPSRGQKINSSRGLAARFPRHQKINDTSIEGGRRTREREEREVVDELLNTKLSFFYYCRIPPLPAVFLHLQGFKEQIEAIESFDRRAA